MDYPSCDALIIGGGPAGLRAAEIVSQAGWRTAVAERMPSVGRKFLVAGKGGLNLTHAEPVKNFPARYRDDRWKNLLEDFSPQDLRAWAESLGIETFVGTSGRVFPVTKQAAPILRRWVERLRAQDVKFHLRHSMASFGRLEDGSFQVDFNTPGGPAGLSTRTVIFALGGASWPQTGSDGAWVALLEQKGVRIAALSPANCGYEVDWPVEFLRQAEGLPLKNIQVSAGDQMVAGELLLTSYGLEGGALYQLGHTLRTMHPPRLVIDLKPAFSLEQLAARLPSLDPAEPLVSQAARAWRLRTPAPELLRLLFHGNSVAKLAVLVKAYPIALTGPRPLAESISSAGGVRWNELTDELMLKSWPGIFCVGEMVDWEAPTGGYLLQGCFSTATRAARAAVRFLK